MADRRRAFAEVPRHLREALGRLVGVPDDEVILGNSTSYGLNLLAQGLPLAAGDELLLVEGDFPATVYPWLPLRERGVRVRLVSPPGGELTREALAVELTNATRAVCSSWVNSFSGRPIDLVSVGEICHERGIWFDLAYRNAQWCALAPGGEIAGGAASLLTGTGSSGPSSSSAPR